MKSVTGGRSSLSYVLALAVVVIAGAHRTHAAETCPVDERAISNAGGYGNAVTAAIKNQFSCEGAYRLLEICQLGSSGDNALSDIVVSKCEPRFLAKAIPATKAAYDKARAKCTAIATKKEGSMYQGLAAVCLARTGRDFARKYGTKS
jgi:hypothetical protein